MISTLAAALTLSAIAMPQPVRSTLPPETKAQRQARMAWWNEARFGLFIHWGLYAIPAGEWKDRTSHGEWIRETARIPRETYEQFLPQFNPVKFEAEAWVKMAKNAGMKYIVITTKHHDGFALFDSAHTEWDIMSTPYRRDIMDALAKACRKHGVKMCWYHSIMDWHHPDYLPRRSWETWSTEGANFDRYVEYLHRQVTELLTKYGDIGVMWFDGEWESTWNHKYGQALYDLCRRLQPNVIVNNRVDVGRGGMAGFTEAGNFAGDFGTPEQEIPATGVPGVDWESCMTMNSHWGWNRADTAWKSTQEMVRMLIDIASKGGNFLLNVGPTAEGEFPPKAVERLAGIGEWMKVNGPAIHGTSASPFDTPAWGRVTTKRDGRNTKLFLHVFEVPAGGELVLDGFGNDLVGARRLDGGAVKATRRGSAVVLSDLSKVSGPATVIELTVRGAPVVYKAPVLRAESLIFTESASVRLEAGSPGIEVRYTLDGSEPTGKSPVAKGPVTVKKTTTITAKSFHQGKAVSSSTKLKVEKVVAPEGVPFAGSKPGLMRREFAGTWEKCPDFAKLTAQSTGSSRQVELGASAGRENHGLEFSGFIRVDEPGVYRFALTSDDGSMLWIRDQVAVDNDGLHGSETKEGFVALATGFHPIRVAWFNRTGGASLELQWCRVGGKLKPIPMDRFRHEP